VAKIELYVKWSSGVAECYCHPMRKCEHKNDCEYMEININPYEGLSECIAGQHTYHKINGRVRQVR